MRLEYIELNHFRHLGTISCAIWQNFRIVFFWFIQVRAIESAKIEFNGKSTVIFGINGTGKSTILRSINLLYANIINQIVNRKELKQNYAIQLEDIQYGKKETKIAALIDLEDEKIPYHRGMIRNTGKKYHNKNSLKQITDIFHEKYVTDEEQKNIPIFVNYGTNRLVLDIPLRIRTHYVDIEQKNYRRAMEKTEQLAEITNENHPDVIMARMELKRRMR